MRGIALEGSPPATLGPHAPANSLSLAHTCLEDFVVAAVTMSPSWSSSGTAMLGYSRSRSCCERLVWGMSGCRPGPSNAPTTPPPWVADAIVVLLEVPSRACGADPARPPMYSQACSLTSASRRSRLRLCFVKEVRWVDLAVDLVKVDASQSDSLLDP